MNILFKEALNRLIGVIPLNAEIQYFFNPIHAKTGQDKTGNRLGKIRIAVRQNAANIFPALILFAVTLVSQGAQAERIKDLADVAGVRNNQLAGYGLVVGLDNSGDQTMQTPFTVQTVINMLSNMGIQVPPVSNLQLKNVAAVMVTATLPPFARSGQQIDVTVSSMGNAKSLKGGTLVMAPLRGADGQVYAMAQGNLAVSGAGAQAAGSRVTINHLSVGRIANGATVEREVPMPLGEPGVVYFELRQSDFGNAQRVVEAINRAKGGNTAAALDGRRIRIRAPNDGNARVAFLGQIEELNITPTTPIARVIVNSRSGAVVMNQAVTLDNCAVAHGNLNITVTAQNTVSQPNPLAAGRTVETTNANINIKEENREIANVQGGANLADVVKALNAIGATPSDLSAILQAMKAAGALHAELEII